MKIGVMADTHLLKDEGPLSRILKCLLKDVDLIVHAGDIISCAVLEAFEDKPWIAVRGNADLPDVRRVLPTDHLLDLQGYRIAVVHDAKSINDLTHRYGALDCLICGHTHHPENYLKGEVLYFNPGSATGNRHLFFNSIGIITIEDELKGEILDIRDI